VNGSVDSCGNGATITYGEQCFPSYSTGSFVNIPLYYVNQIETSALSNYNSLQATTEAAELARLDVHAELHMGPLD
jgi:hypothetical protein